MFVLHSHLPFARLAGRWPHGEEWIHEAASETYIPLLNALYDLKERGVHYRLTLGITPTLAEQLADPLVLDHLDEYLDMRIAAAARDVDIFAPGSAMTSYGHPLDAINQDEVAIREQMSRLAGSPALPVEMVEEPQPYVAALARWYHDWYQQVKNAFHERFQRDLIGAFRQLQDAGYIEIMASAATHAYLPLLSRDSSIYAQIRVGVQTHERLFGNKPRVFWLPECAYRPAFEDETSTLRRGLEGFLKAEGIQLFFSDAHTITGGRPVGVTTGDVIGPYGAVRRRYEVPQSEIAAQRSATTYQPYWVADAHGASSGVAVIGRNAITGHQVWSGEIGYPGDFDYREFHKRAGTSGLQYWRVTGDRVDLAHKDLYHPDWATCKVEQHAEHFVHLVGDLLRDYARTQGRPGLVASNYDTELFGHWWFEGVNWLSQVLTYFAQAGDIELMTASEYLAANPPTETLALPESSWGAGGKHFTWDNHETHWMWDPIHESEGRMEDLVARFTHPTADELRVLNQAARELMLLQSSDWPFLVTTGQAREYAIQRFNQHLERFNRLADGLLNGTPDVEFADEINAIDSLFPDIDYRVFRPQ
jgi:1,4-alpha-glucan branching enzyme